MNRPARGHAEGCLSGRRWQENEIEKQSPNDQRGKDAEKEELDKQPEDFLVLWLVFPGHLSL